MLAELQVLSLGYDLLVKAAGIDEYLQALRSVVRAYWSGQVDDTQAFDMVASSAERRLRQAYSDGMAECGLTLEDMKPEEQLALANAILNERQYIQGMLSRIVTQADGGLLREAYSTARVGAWANRYRDLQNRAKVSACADLKYEWILGPTEEHCRDCSKYSGRVYRGSIWEKYNIRPQSANLSCHGINCLCELRPTDKRVTRGRPPRMTG